MINEVNELIQLAREKEKKVIAVASAGSSHVLQAINEAAKLNIADFICYGDRNKIEEVCKQENIMLNDNIKIIDCQDEATCAEEAVKCVKENRAQVVMKGHLQTSTFLRAILKKETGLRAAPQVSTVVCYNRIDGKGVQFLTDVAMSIKPNIEQKKEIINNAVKLARRIGIEKPKVALLGALELVNLEMEESIDAAILSKMAERGQIKSCVIDGPLALDNILSIDAAKDKGINSVVAGSADIIVAPNLTVGNSLVKALTYFAQMDVAGAVVGTSAPVIMSSRTDSVQNKLLTIALACATAD